MAKIKDEEKAVDAINLDEELMDDEAEVKETKEDSVPPMYS